ncbi:MAG: ribonuclease E, partial [Pseudomonadota bacterium]|nr:ribonuclease E [Pseudomonadota bacterium]
NTDANSEEHGQKREGRGRSRRSPRHVRAAGQRRKKESQQVDDSDTQAKQPGELSPQQSEAEVEATAKTDAPVVEETQAKEPGQLAPAEEQPVSKQEKAKLDVEAVQDELQFDAEPSAGNKPSADAEPSAGKEPSADAEPSANDKPSEAVDSTDEVTSADDNATTEAKPAKEAQTSVQESNVEVTAPAAQAEPAVEAKTTQADTASEAKDEATASPEQVEINLADAPVVAEPEAQVQEAKADTPATKEEAETTAAPSSSLAASGKGKRGASHPMALPAAVNDAFVDVALTAKADDTRPALAVSGKTAAMSHVTSRASAVTTLPQSVDDVAEVAAVAE